jgi:hypothetical protein
MRLLLAALLVALPGLADAQTIVSAAPAAMLPAPVPLPPTPGLGLPLAPIGLPLADIALPLAPIGTPSPSTITRTPTRTVPAAGGRREPSRPRGLRHKGRPGAPGVVYVVPAYGWGLPGYPDAGAPEPVPENVATGTLWLDIEPRGAGEVYIDGYLAGTTMDVRGSMLLDAGVHRVEIRAAGYHPIGVGVRIEAGGVVTLRRALQPLAAPAAPPAAAPDIDEPPAANAVPIVRKPFYYIPGCYLGDVPPKDAGLAPTCDLNKMVVIQP